MNISRTADHILEHPYFSEASRKFLRGDDRDMRILLIDLMAHVSFSQNGLDARTFNKRRRETYPDIELAIRENACSCNLNFNMPIPDNYGQIEIDFGKNTGQLELECRVVNINNEEQIAL